MMPPASAARPGRIEGLRAALAGRPLLGLAAAAGAVLCLLALWMAWGGRQVSGPGAFLLFAVPAAALGALFAFSVHRDAKPTALAALDVETDAVVFLFEHSGEVAEVSPASHALLNLAPVMLLANGFFERLHVSDRVGFLCALADLRHGAERRKVELRVRLPRGEHSRHDRYGTFTLDLALRSGPLPFIGLLRDASALHEMRTELDAANGALERAECEKTRLLAALGHELRTPLNAIVGFSGLLGQESFGGFRDPRQKEYAGLIANCGEHMLAVLESLLDTARLRAGARALELESFSLGEAIAQCRAMLALQAGAKGVTLRSDIEANCGSVRADRRIVRQILVNLLSNAVKFTPPGGVVTVGARRAGLCWQLSVGDTGIGIEEGDLSRIGAPFTRLGEGAERSEGAGLGLSLVRELAIQHGGTFTLQSMPGAGTTATVIFPDCPAQGRAPADAAAPAAAIGFAAERGRNGAQRRTA